MNLLMWVILLIYPGVPHRRGDEPQRVHIDLGSAKSSPQAWG